MIITVPIEGRALAPGQGDQANPVRWSAFQDRLLAMGKKVGYPGDCKATLLSVDWDAGTARVEVEGLHPALEMALQDAMKGKSIAAIRVAWCMGNYCSGDMI